MWISSRLLLNAATAVALLMIGGMGWLAFRGISSVMESNGAVTEAQNIQSSLAGTFANLERAEAAQRNYVITGQRQYARELQASAAEMRRRLAELREYDWPTPSAAADVRTLERLVSMRLTILDEVAGLYDQAGFEAVQSQIEEGIGAGIMDSVHVVISRLEENEQADLAAGAAATRANAGEARKAILAALAAAVLVLATLGFVINRDITVTMRQRRQLETAVSATNAANAAKTEFLATVSHEIRTPLNAILGMTDLIRATPLSSEQAELSRTIYSNGEALLILINDLLDSSKIEAGQLDLELVQFDLREVVDAVLDILVVRAEGKGLELISDVDPCSALRLIGDPNRLRQIIMNLAGNAIKFTTSGEVSVHAACERHADAPDVVDLHLAIRDTGVGIAPEDQKRIFEPFVQADASTVRRFSGTGLGLTISKALSQMMGGRIDLESEPGKGSTFHVYLPLKIAEAPPEGEGRVDVLKGAPALLVEHNATSRVAITRLLHYEGMSVDSAMDAFDALQFAKSGTEYQVVIVDEQLPDVKGADLVRALRQRLPTAPIVLLCSLRAASISPEQRSLAVDCVYKPVKRARLVASIARALDPQATVGPALTAAETTSPRKTARPLRILVAEDNRDNWVLMTRILASAGHEVDLAENGKIALARAERFRYDLILMDLEMPVMDGFRAAQKIRALETDQSRERVPIVAVTAHAIENFRERALESGMDDYMTKPMKKARLLSVVAQWTDARPVILVVDDSVENHVLIRKFTESRAYRIVSVHDGGDAVQAFYSRRISLVLLDMDLPTMSGYEVARRLRRTSAGRSVPIVAMTGYEGKKEREKCFAAGCSAFLQKPIRREDLLAHIEKGLDASDYLTETIERTVPTERRSLARKTGALSSELSFLEAKRRDLEELRQLVERGNFQAIALAAGRLLVAAQRDHAHQRVAEIARQLVSAGNQHDSSLALFNARRLTDLLDEGQRLLMLEATGLLDSPAEERFDRLTRMAAARLGVPVALATLVTEDRQFFKSQVGVGEPWASDHGTPLSHSFCQQVVLGRTEVAVEDARKHPDFSCNPAIDDLGVIAYAGIPLVAPGGQIIGSFCAIDHQPRHWTDEDLRILRELAAEANEEVKASVRPSLAAGADKAAYRTGKGGGDGQGSVAGDDTPSAKRVPIYVPVDNSVADLVPNFLEQRQANLQVIRELLHNKDFPGIQRLGHNMKGSGQSYGFAEISAIGKAIEESARARHTSDVRKHCERLQAYLEDVRIVPGEQS